MYFEEAKKRAVELGAIKCMREEYPKRSGYHPDRFRSTVFAYRYFNAEGHEVGYYLPDMTQFHPPGTIVEFNPPRVCADAFKAKLVDVSW